MKKLLFIFCIILSIFITSCEWSQPGDDIVVPAGAIRLTKHNFDDYFSIKVSSKEEWWEHGVLANAYVSIAPKNIYQEVVGTIELKLNTYVYRYSSDSPTFHIKSENIKIDLNNEVVSNKYTLTCQDDDLKINPSSNTADIIKVNAYLITGKKDLNELEKLTEEQIANSENIKLEVGSLINDWKTICNNAVNYQFNKNELYYYSSYFGEDFSKSSGLNSGQRSVVDKENQTLKLGNDIYSVYKDNFTIRQEKIEDGMIYSHIDGIDMNTLVQNSTFNFEGLIDSSCKFIKENDHTYVAYTTFDKMINSSIKEDFFRVLNSYRIKSNHDDFIIKYTYIFLDDSLEIKVNLDFKDYHFHIDFYKITHEYSQKIFNINKSPVIPYSSETNDFVLCKNLDDAIATNAGLIKVDTSTTELNFKTYNDEYGSINIEKPNYDNYLPIEITEPGRYSFENIKYEIVDANKNPYYEPYFEKGIYYIEINFVKYGIRNRTIKVTSSKFNDYGDINNPIKIKNNKFSCYLEGYGDMQVYSFTPTKDGIYELTKQNDVIIRVYNEDNLEEYINLLRYQSFACYFEANTKYVFIIEVYNYDGAVNYEGFISYIGLPSKNLNVTLEWNEYIVYDDYIFDVDILKTGDYQVEVEVLAGEYSNWTTFYKEDGSQISIDDYIIDENDVCTYTLVKGKYKLQLSSYSNEYLHARIRLVLVTEAVEEENNIELFYDEYITLTSSILTTTYSTSKFYFNVEKDSYIYIMLGSNSFKVFDLDGNQVKIDEWQYISTDKEFNNIEIKKSPLLKAGSYYIVFEKSRYANKPTSYSATLRLKEA